MLCFVKILPWLAIEINVSSIAMSSCLFYYNIACKNVLCDVCLNIHIHKILERNPVNNSGPGHSMKKGPPVIQIVQHDNLHHLFSMWGCPEFLNHWDKESNI